MRVLHTAHEFSFYVPNASKIALACATDTVFVIDDVRLCHRIARVLRLKQDEVLVLFDEASHMRVKIVSCDAHHIKVLLLEKLANVALEPRCVYYIPLLKRDALEQALYSAVELGASEIRLMKTERTQGVWAGEKELSRLRLVMIAAAEQSKQYAIPSLYAPQPFPSLTNAIDISNPFLFFDVYGEDLFPFVMRAKTQKPANMSFMIGPEADLTNTEKQILRAKGIQFYRLTATTLRAQQALAVSLGIVRSFLR